MIIKTLRRLFGRGDAEDDRVLAYLEDRASAEDSRHLEESEDLESLRQTVRMLRNVDDVEAPRSFAVTEENLSRHGYSQDEIDRVLHPRNSGIRTGIGSIPAYVPLILAGIAVLGAVLLTISDITDFVIDDLEMSDPSAPGLPGDPGESGQPGAPGQSGQSGVAGISESADLPGATAEAASVATAMPAIAAVAEKEEKTIVQTVVVERVVEVERQVIQTVEVERVVEREVVHTVEVEMEREVMSEVVIETVVVREEVAFDAPDEVIDSMDGAPVEISTPTPVPPPTFTPVPTAAFTPMPTEISIPTATPKVVAFVSPANETVSEGSDRDLFGLQLWIIQAALILIAALSLLAWAWTKLRR